jgi:branched-chain amino acid transport system permease protein
MAGAMQAHYVLVINPHDLGFYVSLNFVIFLLFGGMQSLAGAALGAVILTAAPELLRFSDQYRLILYGLIIVLVVLIRPDGLLKRVPTGVERRVFGIRLGAPARGRAGSRAEREVLVDKVLPKAS